MKTRQSTTSEGPTVEAPGVSPGPPDGASPEMPLNAEHLRHHHEMSRKYHELARRRWELVGGVLASANAEQLEEPEDDC